MERVLARRGARELSQEELELASGGFDTTKITHCPGNGSQCGLVDLDGPNV